MSEIFDVVKWRLYQRLIMKKNVKGFNSHFLTYSCSQSTYSEYSHLLKNSIVKKSNLGRFSRISGGCINNCEIGNFSGVATRSYVGGGGEHPVDQVSYHSVFYKASKYQHPNFRFTDVDIYDDTLKKVIIGNDVWVGSDCFIKPGIKIGHGAVIATGSVVVKDVEPYAIVGGVPAAVIKFRHSPELIEMLLKSDWWDWSIDKLKVITDHFEQAVPLSVSKFNLILEDVSRIK